MTGPIAGLRPGGDRLRSQMPAAASVFNRGKRSIVLQLNQQEDRQRLLDLIERADVFVESWRPGVAGRLGADYEALHKINPRLIYCSLSGFGQDGPHAGTHGYEATVHAVVGSMASQVGLRDGPIYPGLPLPQSERHTSGP